MNTSNNTDYETDSEQYSEDLSESSEDEQNTQSMEDDYESAPNSRADDLDQDHTGDAPPGIDNRAGYETKHAKQNTCAEAKPHGAVEPETDQPIAARSCELPSNVQASHVVRVNGDNQTPAPLNSSKQAPLPQTPTVEIEKSKSAQISEIRPPTCNSKSSTNIIPTQITMTTQTEWNLWRIPDSESTYTLSASGGKQISPYERMLGEWREFEKRAEKRDEQQVKLNIVRSCQIKADKEIARLKSNLDDTNRKLNEALEKNRNRATRSIQAIRRIPVHVRSTDDGTIPSIPTELVYTIRPHCKSHHGQPQASAIQPPTPAMHAPTSYRQTAEQRSSATPNAVTSVSNTPLQYSEPPTNVNTARGNDSTKNHRGVIPEKATTSSNLSTMRLLERRTQPTNAYKEAQPGPPSTKPDQRKISTVPKTINTQRNTPKSRGQVNQQKSSYTASNKLSGPMQKANQPNTRGRANGNGAAVAQLSESWADDDVSDAELINITGSTPPNPQTRSASYRQQSKIKDDSRRDILETAIKEASRRDSPMQLNNRNNNMRQDGDKDGGKKGEKRVLDAQNGNEDLDVSVESYADVG